MLSDRPNVGKYSFHTLMEFRKQLTLTSQTVQDGTCETLGTVPDIDLASLEPEEGELNQSASISWECFNQEGEEP